MAGKVYLVGAGPGDWGLLTMNGFSALGRAEVILYDRLVPTEMLDALPAVERIYVGKEPGKPAMEQEEINARLVELARAGKTVVRLKGGDPFVFGRGGEEAEALAAAQVPFEVIPGITAGIAAPEYAGIPVTHRGRAAAVAFVTGHEDPSKPESDIDWSALAAFPGTLVFYMGVRNLATIASSLTDAGRRADEPVAVIERGTTPHQRTVVGTLTDIADRVAQADVGPPAITIVGSVVELRERIAWFERSKPLLGKSVVVTRAREQASALAGRLIDAGAAVIQAPVIRIEPLPTDAIDRAAERIGDYALVCVTSGNAVGPLFDALRRRGLDTRGLAGIRFAAIGDMTAQFLNIYGINPDVVPERSVAEGLLEALSDEQLEGRRVLIPSAETARDVLLDGLRERGAEVDVVPVYRTVAHDPTEQSLQAAARADYVTFTSSSTVRYFADAIGDRFPRDARVVSIGPQTSATARELGIEVHVEAGQHDIDGLVDALLKDGAG